MKKISKDIRRNYIKVKFSVKKFKESKYFLAFQVTLLILFLLLYRGLCKTEPRREIDGWPSFQPRDVPGYLEPAKMTTILSSQICKNNSNPIFLLIIVHSAPKNFDLRNTIRQTWGNTLEYNYPLFEQFHGSGRDYLPPIVRREWWKYTDPMINSDIPNFRVKVVFLVGMVQSEDVQLRIEDEYERYDDVIQENFLESYNNLTLKTIFMLKWATRNCLKKTKYLMKVDDDVFLNIPNLIHVLLGGTVPLYPEYLYHCKSYFYKFKSFNPLDPSYRILNMTNTIIGCKFESLDVNRNPWDKFFMPHYMFNETKLPDFIGGSAYVMLMETAQKLYQESMTVPIIFIEDAYLNGLVAERLNITRLHHSLFFPDQLYHDCSARAVISIHYVRKETIRKFYEFVNDKSAVCPVY